MHTLLKRFVLVYNFPQNLTSPLRRTYIKFPYTIHFYDHIQYDIRAWLLRHFHDSIDYKNKFKLLSMKSQKKTLNCWMYHSGVSDCCWLAWWGSEICDDSMTPLVAALLVKLLFTKIWLHAPNTKLKTWTMSAYAGLQSTMSPPYLV